MTLFKVSTRDFGWDELVAAAQVWSEWQPFFESVREALACLGVATHAGQLPSSEKMREVATAFRYAHNLISAEETQVWLERCEMTVEDWMSCLRGQLLRENWTAHVNEIMAANQVSDAEVTAVIKRYAVCAGKVGDWAQRLAGRAAIATSSCGDSSTSLTPPDLITCIEAEFELKRKQAITPKAIETRIDDNRLDWIHYECRYLWLAEERVAREAAWCVSEDGLSLEEVASDARAEVQQWNFYADEIEASVRPYFLGSRQGDLLGPLKFREGYPLFSVMGKRMPSAMDPQILSRAEDAIVKSLLAQAVNAEVKWVGCQSI